MNIIPMKIGVGYYDKILYNQNMDRIFQRSNK